LPAARWLLRTARPRNATDVLTLAFAFLSVATGAATIPLAVLHGRSPTLPVTWTLVLALIAVLARLSPWWRPHLANLTLNKARVYLAALLLIYVAATLTGHLLLSSLGLSEAYPLLGPFSSLPGGGIVLGLLTATAVGLAINLPVWTWTRGYVGQAVEAIRSAGEERVVDAVQVSEIPYFEPLQLETDDEEHLDEEKAPPAAVTPEPTPTLGAMLPPPDNGPALPPIDLFAPPPKGPASRMDLDYVSQRIEETLASFGVAARVVGNHCGPVVTQFDVQPERGVKVKSITSLQNDLALALAAPTIRIQAPVPGKPVVGIEIPNTAAATVTLRELLESEQYRSTHSPLRVPLGKDVAGTPAIIDLAKMPHLLIAGATGSGKSACVNALIGSLLYANGPDQVRLMMVDPKMVELTVYNGVPHLLSPVVTEMDKVVGVLQWALREMERRYKLFAETTVRNINRFNEKAESLGLKPLPYIVLIVDELADLMMVSPEDVEDAICRLAQLARAAGIHLIIATQRPSVDVVTGLIKANFPARIAFAMTSQVDSRTILDTVGAEKLLGRGDMLYQPPDGPKPIRLQGAFLHDQEIERLVEFWHRSPLQAAVQRVAEEEFAAAAKAAESQDDDLLQEAIDVVREYQHASVSLLQRRLKVGYARAARLMDQLEAHGVVGPADGSKQRPVLEEPI
jgi:DNA segregation ATPase FtsK/SpoIIIE-like protein